MQLEILDSEYSICQLAGNEPLPEWALSPWCSITRTGDELSIVVRDEVIPKSVPREDGWRMFRVCGPLDFGIVGVIARISGVLAAKNISLFVVSTFQTDYVLVKAEDIEMAKAALVANGYEFV